MYRLLLISFLFAGLAAGDTMTYTVTGNGSGYWGSQVFTNADFTFTFFIQDTTSITVPPCCSSIRTTPAGTAASVTVKGMGTASLSPNGDQAIFVYPSSTAAGVWHYNSPDFLTVANPAFTTYDLTSTIGPVTGKTFFYQTPIMLETGINIYFTSVTGVNFSAVRGPAGGQTAVVSVTPGSATSVPGTPETFTFVVSDSAGASDIQGMNILFSDPGAPNQPADPYACWLWYHRSDNTLSIYHNSPAWSATTVGSAQGSPLTGDNCTVYASSAIVSTSGNNLTLTLPIAFLNPVAAPDTLPISVRVENNENVDTGYKFSGSLTLNPGSSPGFAIVATPSLQQVLVGTPATYTLAVPSWGGFNGIVNLSASLVPEDPDGLTTVTIIPSTIVGSGTATMTVESAGQLGTLNVHILGHATTIDASQTATLLVTDRGPIFDIEWDNAVPVLNGRSAVFQFTANDRTPTSITGFNMLIGPELNGQNACWIFSDGRSLWLASDDGKTWMLAGTLQSGSTAHNSQCIVGGNGFNAMSTNLWNIGIPVTFSSSFTGELGVYARGSDLTGLDTGYIYFGSIVLK